MNTNSNADYAALVLRLGLGIMFIAHGVLKIVVFTIPGTMQFFESVGYPGVLAYAVIAMEIGGGALLISGIATRWTALALIPVLLGALKVHLSAGWLFTNPSGGWEYPAFLVLAVIVQALLGPGAYTLRLPARHPVATAA